MVERAWKQPAEARLYSYDFAPLLEGQTISSIFSTASEGRSDNTRTLTNDSQNYSSTVAQVKWSGGVDGETYRTTVVVLDALGQKHELEGEIIVFDRTFILPTGIAEPYLDAEAYVDRFGYDETVRITDEGSKGVIDKASLQAALSDAQQFADGYLATRYTLPIATPAPVMLQQIVADLARERLHTTRPTPQVTANADRARSLLKDLSAGRAVLPTATGELVDAAIPLGSSPIWGNSYGASVFNPDKLDRF